jgi:hypothetical protein
MSRAARTWAAVVLVVSACLVFPFVFLGEVLEITRRGPIDRIGDGERRLDAVRDQLPRTGKVGYVLKVRKPVMLDWYQTYGIIYARNALAPLQVEPDNGHEIVLEDHDDGIRIVRRRAP